MDYYTVNLGVLVASNAALAYWNHNRKTQESNNAPDGEEPEKETESVRSAAAAVSRFKYRFFVVYMLVVASDWLQGSFIYALYKDTLGLPERVVAALFTTGFLCGAISATFVGNLADRHGRRSACLSFCALYALSCITVLSSNVFILFVGRALGGVSATLLFSVFETWMVTEFHRLGLANAGGSLSSIFGTMSALNGIVAIACGVMSEALVKVTGSRRSPFMASIVCLLIASQLIVRYWAENRGEVTTTAEGNSIQTTIKNSLAILDKRTSTLTLASTFFEGSMYILVYFWSPAIISVRATSGTTGDIPFGIIFANFMSAMMLGSLIFASVTARTGDAVLMSSNILQMLLGVASCSFTMTVLSQSEIIRFWSFCVFELCVGMYFPSMGCLKGAIVDDANRGKVYGLMRLPLNVFVVLSLGATQEGEAHRGNMFLICSAFLLVAMASVYRYIAK